MDYDKLIEASLKILDLCMNAAAAIKTLKTENERLQEEAEHWKNAHHQAALNFQQENREHNKALADLTRVTAERDAAVKDLNEFLAMDELCPIQCEWCKWNGTYCDGKTPEWRGVQNE